MGRKEKREMTKKKVVQAVKKLGLASITEVAKETGLHRNTVVKYLKELAESGEVGRKLIGQTQVFWIESASPR